MNYNYTTIAANWRAEQPETRATSGVVLIWQGQAYGWKDKLSNAAHEQPGAVAVDADGHVFIATGGDQDNGAKCWVAL